MASLSFFKLALLTPLLLLVLASSTSSVAQLARLQPKIGCQTQCGDVKVDYPFGIGKRCGRSEHFQLLCKRNDRGRFKTFIRGNTLYDLEVSSISVSEGLARIKNPVSWLCYNRTDGSVTFDYSGANLIQTPFWVSNTRNIFIVIGSNAFAYISLNGTNSGYTAGCVAQKFSKESMVKSSCSGIGCCYATIPIRSKSYAMSFSLLDSNFSSSYSICGYAVLTEVNRFRFSTSYLTTPGSFEKDIVNLSVVLDWTIGNEKCELAQRNITSYACVSSHSTCVDYHGLGYRCSCLHGYGGNPYILHGCQIIKDIQRSVPVPLSK
ncbi:Wall-associated receptor kinase 2 [Rhynchospora pubera]|uniref:Wall-associated receptor kinase 2 n=1 Tax=Rhynchospora pubera TaxID=906938 RepID=A0AAV8EH89_9POAL|nr:Wall-associated receptor kinase 2 [Rhynchospora pubera]